MCVYIYIYIYMYISVCVCVCNVNCLKKRCLYTTKVSCYLQSSGILFVL